MGCVRFVGRVWRWQPVVDEGKGGESTPPKICRTHSSGLNSIRIVLDPWGTYWFSNRDHGLGLANTPFGAPHAPVGMDEALHST